MSPTTLANAQRSRTYFEDKLRELQPYRPETKADPEKAALVANLQERLGNVNEAIRQHYVDEAAARDEAAAPSEGRLF